MAVTGFHLLRIPSHAEFLAHFYHMVRSMTVHGATRVAIRKNRMADRALHRLRLKVTMAAQKCDMFAPHLLAVGLVPAHVITPPTRAVARFALDFAHVREQQVIAVAEQGSHRVLHMHAMRADGHCADIGLIRAIVLTATDRDEEEFSVHF